VHGKFKTPYIAVIVFSLIAIAILLPGFFAADVFANMGALYAVGSLLAFMFAHASIIGMRLRKPGMERPFKLGGNIRIKGRDIPVTAVIGLLATTSIWIIILITQSYSRWVGLGWMVVGLVIYFFLQRRRRRPADEWRIKREK
jgi:APA family basic amino acid/polyamine antiporter